jgi:hypothetical protein
MVANALRRCRTSRRLLLAFGAAMALAGGLTATGAAAADYGIEAAEFIVSVDDGEGNERRIASTLVPYLPDRACFGWRIRLGEPPSVVRVREVLQLPSAPAFWSGEDDPYSLHVFSADRTTATTEDYKAPEDGWIFNEWCIAEGDPVGAHAIDVFIEDELVRHFEFEVKRPRQSPGN